MKPIPKDTIRLSDWSGFTTYGGTAEVPAPENEEDVARLVRDCFNNGQKLRVVGCQTSWSTLWHCEDVMMSMKRLNAIREINVNERTITCETGVTLTEVHKALWERGLSLNNAPAVDWVTVGGAIATGSHGSGGASISSSMIACRLVTGTGEIVEIGEGDERLDGVRISLGLLGVLTCVTLQVVDAFDVSIKTTRIPTADWGRFLTEGEMSYALCFPHTEYSVLARVDVLGPPARGRIVASRQAQPVSTPGPIELGVSDMKAADLAVRRLANRLTWTFPARNRFILDVFLRDSVQSGPAHEMLMSFTSDPIAGAEWAVPVRRFAAALADLQRETTPALRCLPILWLKKVKGESAWLSAADEPSVQCGIYHNVFPDAPSLVKEMVTSVEQMMLGHGGRPHLGKLIYMEPSALKQAYPYWSKFEALRRQLDPKGVFWSKAIEARFGELTYIGMFALKDTLWTRRRL